MKWDDFKTELSTMLCLARMPFWAITMKDPSKPDSLISVDSKFAASLTSFVPDVPNLVVEVHAGIFEGKASALVDVTNSTEGGWASKENVETTSKALSLATRDAVLEIIVPMTGESQLDLHHLEHVKRDVITPLGFSARIVRYGGKNSLGIFQDSDDTLLSVFSLQNSRVFESTANDIRGDGLRHFKQIPTHSFDVSQLGSLSPKDWSNLFALWISKRAFRTIGQLVQNPLLYRDYCKALWAAPKRLARKFTLDYRSGLRDFGPSSQAAKSRLQEIKGDFAL